jgi:hypothetical protein
MTKLVAHTGDTAEALMIMQLLLDPQCALWKSDDLQVFDPAAPVSIHGGSWRRGKQPLPPAPKPSVLGEGCILLTLCVVWGMF